MREFDEAKINKLNRDSAVLCGRDFGGGGREKVNITCVYVYVKRGEGEKGLRGGPLTCLGKFIGWSIVDAGQLFPVDLILFSIVIVDKLVLIYDDLVSLGLGQRLWSDGHDAVNDCARPVAQCVVATDRVWF
ncbi:hypothetical protein RRG08_057690 [Elysia crispata]|uniref:Uncharacterized protein n=1 Tax=Elysia crispata TaxID=231223 RepID=A0AAE1DYJ5_9GAST|nr:hypothetical protein RRG08_057690 [Elysia crispata]